MRALASRQVSTVAGDGVPDAEATRIESLFRAAGTWFSRGWSRALERAHEPRFVAEAAALVAILAIGIGVRLHFASFLDPFEDGYQNWWISANFLQTGQYWDRHSMMTQGNWLPLYHLEGAVLLAVAGWHNLDALKAGNVVVSALTAGLLYASGRRTSATVGLAAAVFFSLNFIDIVVSGWSTAESLATFLVFLGYACLFRSDPSRALTRAIGAAAFTLAVLTRYEAWLVLGLVAVFVIATRRGMARRTLLVAFVPAFATMIGYFAYALQWGFLPAILVAQTSTDLRFQISAGTQPTPEVLLGRFWTGYVGFFPGVLAVGGVTAVLRLRRDVGGWIALALSVFVIGYTVLRFGNPSYRYVMIGVPFLSLFAAEGLVMALRQPSRSTAGPQGPTRSWRRAVLALGAAVLSLSLLVAPVTYWTAGFQTSEYMEPLQRAGQYLAAIPLPAGKLLLTESPIAAYYSRYPADRMLGSRWLPDDRAAALAFLQANAAFLVYVGVPYYKLRTLFPELEAETGTPEFELLFDAGGRAAGTHAVFVYRVRGGS